MLVTHGSKKQIEKDAKLITDFLNTKLYSNINE